MHEYSLAQNIIGIVERYKKQQPAGNVCEVALEIGELSGVMVEALQSAVTILVSGTELEKTNFVYEIKKPKARCRNCGEVLTISDFLASCTKCGSSMMDIIEGKELHIKTLSFVPDHAIDKR